MCSALFFFGTDIDFCWHTVFFFFHDVFLGGLMERLVFSGLMDFGFTASLWAWWTEDGIKLQSHIGLAPKKGMYIMEHPIEMGGWLGVPPCCGNLHIQTCLKLKDDVFNDVIQTCQMLRKDNFRSHFINHQANCYPQNSANTFRNVTESISTWNTYSAQIFDLEHLGNPMMTDHKYP